MSYGMDSDSDYFSGACVTFADVQLEYGEDFADQLLGFRRHFSDESGEPYWLVDEFEDLLGLLEGLEARDP
jgi:hypothetical protein